jgi:hypothetical protein
MIGHCINSNHFMIMILNDAGDVLMQSFFPVFCYQSLSVFYSKNAMDMYLCVGVWHSLFVVLPRRGKLFFIIIVVTNLMSLRDT